MKRILLILLAMVMLSGCAQHFICTKLNLDPEQFKRDNFECHQQSKTYWVGMGLVGIIASSSSAQYQADKTYKMCMEARGYEVITKEEAEKRGLKTIVNENNETVKPSNETVIEIQNHEKQPKSRATKNKGHIEIQGQVEQHK